MRAPPSAIALRLALAAVLASPIAGCGARSELPGAHGRRDGSVVCAPDQAASLTGRIRDFSAAHPDFEDALGEDPDIVSSTLGADRTPMYAPGASGTTPTTSGEANFNQWFHDVEGVNLGRDFTLPLSGDIGGFTFGSAAFFPIDDELLGNQGREHNFHFTLELHGTFRYRGGEVFEIEGDDDLYIFVKDRLAVNLGGVHATRGGSADVDAMAPDLGIFEGDIVPLDVFFCERHTEGSTLRVSLRGPELCLAEEP